MSVERQLQTIVARAFADEQLREARALPGERYEVTLASGQRLIVQFFGAAAEVATAAAALGMLRAEVDLPIPQLRASDPESDSIGQPYVALAEVGGEPLEQVLPRIPDEQLYALGRQLGEVACRIHRIAARRYGALTGDDPDAAADERSYVLARLERDLRRCGELGLLDRQSAAELRDYFQRGFKPVGRQPALICGDLRPETLLVRQHEGRWRLGGVLGWQRALGWSPAWEHVTFFDASEHPGYFGLRVGYGNGYDAQTQRTYEQVREHAMAPYRVLLALQRIQQAHAAGAMAECERRRGVLRGVLRALGA